MTYWSLSRQGNEIRVMKPVDMGIRNNTEYKKTYGHSNIIHVFTDITYIDIGDIEQT